jgi:glycosyltransferase involved in cell wall biosynthesis
VRPTTSFFFAYRDSRQRRSALAAPRGSDERYVLFGLDELEARGFQARHNLELGAPPRWARSTGAGLKWALERAGGYGGDFDTVLASLRSANRADVVLSTVDTVGIPLMLLKRAGALRPPLLYVAVGLPERLARLRNEPVRRLYARSLAATAAVVTYSSYERAELAAWVAEHGRGAQVRAEFVPFGVDTRAYTPPEREPTDDVVSVGADPHRDFDLLVRVAEALPEVTFRIVTTAERARSLAARPGNVSVEVDLPFAEMRLRLERARVVALPVLENSYSGATTVLLQALALAKPVVVTRTHAIADGYGLVDGESCRLVPAGDEAAFARALSSVLGDELHARSLGARGRVLVERELSWERYVDRIERLLTDAFGARPDDRSRRA